MRRGNTTVGSRLLAYVLGLAAAFAASLLLAASASAAFPGANGRIAFGTTPPGGPALIHTILPSGHGNKGLGAGSMPSWSPNGQRIAFVGGIGSQTEIYSMGANGGDVRRVTYRHFDDKLPSYSPNGNRILFTENRGFGPVVMTIRADGTDLHTLAQGGGGAWSPNGKWIAYGRSSDPAIWVVRPDGTNKHRLIKSGGPIGGYSPDGSRITFARCDDVECRYFVANSDGTNIRPLPCPADYFRGLTAPGFSPDGRRLLGETDYGINSVDVVTLPLHSCSPRVVASLGVNAAPLPAWQPLPTP